VKVVFVRFRAPLQWYYLYIGLCSISAQHLMAFSNGRIGFFTGGTVVHMSAGWAALAGAIFLGKRKYKKK
jgi:Amt family ammonium transporter